MHAPRLIRPSPFERDFGPFVTAEATGGSAQVMVAIERFAPQPQGVSVQNPALRICRHLDAPLSFSRRMRGGRFGSSLIAPGQFFLFGAESEAQFSWASGFRTLSFTIMPGLLDDLPREGGGQDALRVRGEDAVLERLTALALLDAQPGFPRGPLFAEGIGLALAAHLAACGVDGRRGAGRALSPRALAIVRDAIEAALPGRIGLAELAAASGHPAYRLGADFRRATGRSLWDYAAERRLARVEALLREGDLPLGTVAARVGYSSQAHMTTAFRRHHGMTLSAWRALRRA